MRHLKIPTIVLLISLFALTLASRANAQQAQPPVASTDVLSLSTAYPSQVIGVGEGMNISLNLQVSDQSQIVALSMKEIPDGWSAVFRGGGHIVESAYVSPGEDSTVDLRLDPPADAPSGLYKFVVQADGEKTKAELPIQLTIREKLPPRLSLSADLATVRGTPSGTFTYNLTLKNEGDEDLTISLLSETSTNMIIKFKLTGQEVTGLPLAASESKRITMEAKPVSDLDAGDYPIQVQAQGGEVQASLDLTAEVTGQPELKISTSDSRLSGQANAGKTTPFKIILDNPGSAPTYGVQLTSSAPSGWAIDFQPSAIDVIPAGQSVEVTANIQPADKALAGDYVVTLRANSSDAGINESVDFRITVETSTLWGVVGITLIAVAVGVVVVAVVRFGRR